MNTNKAMGDFERNEKNKIVRGSKRAVYNKEQIFSILDSTFLCHIGVVKNGMPMVIPTSYGRENETLYIHGASTSQLLNLAQVAQEICVTVTILDGLVLARSMFDTSANYRSVVMYGKASLVEDDRKIETLKIISDHIIDGRFNEVELGPDNALKATQVIQFEIETASAKIRDGGPQGDERLRHLDVWAGHIPMKTIAQEPIADAHLDSNTKMPKSVLNYCKKYT